MPTLSRFKERVFKVGKWLGIAISTILIVVIVFKGIFFVKEALWPTPPPPPTVSFGKLDNIVFPEGIKKTLAFKIDTVSGQLPQFPDRATVFEMATYQPDLLAVEKTTEKVKTLGFSDKPTQISETVYRWQAEPPLSQSLVVNVNFPEFFLSSNFATNPAVLSAQNLPSEIEAKEIAKSFVSGLSLYPGDINEEKTVAILYSLNNGLIEEATSIANTNLISIYFFQKDIERLPIVYPDARSNMNLTIGGGSVRPVIVDARFFYQKVGSKKATYPIKTSREAMEEIKKGKGYVVSIDGEPSEVSIKKVYLAYFIGKQKQDHLLPVVVFEGTNNFLAYVSAVKDEWIEN